MKLKRFNDFKIKHTSNMTDNNINESVLQKDLDRMYSILKKSGNDNNKILNYSRSMAKAIKDKHKAFQRGKAADEVLKNTEAADIFYHRAQELGLDFNINVERSKSGMSKFGIDVPKLGSKMTKVHDEPQKNSYKYSSIAPLGSVNIQTGESEHFNIYDTWTNSTAEVWKNSKGSHILVFTSDDKPLNNIGWTCNFENYYTQRSIGNNWTMVEWVKLEDLKELLRIVNKSSLKGYTYK